jgi:thiol-disulfide isomerase/thioredoxin
MASTVVAAAVWSNAAMAQDRDTSSLKGRPAPEISLQTIDGKSVKLSDQKGKVVLVDMWATWCPPCRKSLPHVQELSANKDLAGRGLVVWAVNSQEGRPIVEKFLKEGNYTFTVPMDTDGRIGETYLVQGIPTTVIVGRDGAVKEVFIGFGPDSAKEVDAAVEKALAGK